MSFLNMKCNRIAAGVVVAALSLMYLFGCDIDVNTGIPVYSGPVVVETCCYDYYEVVYFKERE